MVDDVSHRYDKVLNGFVFEGPDNFSLSIKGSKNLGYLFRESHLWNILNLIHLKVVNCLRIFPDFLLFLLLGNAVLAFAVSTVDFFFLYIICA